MGIDRPDRGVPDSEDLNDIVRILLTLCLRYNKYKYIDGQQFKRIGDVGNQRSDRNQGD